MTFSKTHRHRKWVRLILIKQERYRYNLKIYVSGIFIFCKCNLKIWSVQAGLPLVTPIEMRVAVSIHVASCVHSIMSTSHTDPCSDTLCKANEYFKTCRISSGVFGWYELLSVKKRLLNLRTSWAVITEGKATDAKWRWTRACSCGCGQWLNQRRLRARRLFQNCVFT